MTKQQRLIIYMLVIFVVVFFIALTNFHLLKTQRINQITLMESEILSRGSGLFSRELGHLKSMTLFLRNTVEAKLLTNPLVHQSPTSTQQSSLLSAQKPLDSDDWKEQTALDVFSQFANTSELISQVRWLDLQGNERIRLNVSHGKMSVVEAGGLQNKSSRYYFQQAKYAVGNHVYISPIDLNVEKGEVVMPIEPTVRAVITLDDKLGGILVVNYNLTTLFEDLRALANQTVFLDLINDQGEWMISQQPSQEWALSLGHKNAKDGSASRMILPTLFPIVWKKLLVSDGLSSFIEAGQVWGVIEVMLEDDSPNMSNGKNAPLYFVARTWPNVLPNYRAFLFMVVGSISVVVFLFLSWLAWWQIETHEKRKSLLQALEIEKVHLKNTNKELNSANQQLVMLQDELVENSRLSSLGLMVAGLAHEMNTPLGGIKMAMSSLNSLFLKEGGHLPETSHKVFKNSINIVDKNLSRAIELVSSFKRLTSNQTEHNARPFVFNQALDDLLLTYKPVFKKHPNITLETDIQPDIAMVGHPGVLMQVMQNLIDNALTYAFDEQRKGTLSMSAKTQDDQLVLTIQDTGNGIDPAIRKKIFDPFVTTGRGLSHTGLGLYLVHQWVCKLVAGHIDVTSELGHGTCFTLTIPLNGEAA